VRVHLRSITKVMEKEKHSVVDETGLVMSLANNRVESLKNCPFYRFIKEKVIKTSLPLKKMSLIKIFIKKIDSFCSILHPSFSIKKKTL